MRGLKGSNPLFLCVLSCLFKKEKKISSASKHVEEKRMCRGPLVKGKLMLIFLLRLLSASITRRTTAFIFTLNNCIILYGIIVVVFYFLKELIWRFLNK